MTTSNNILGHCPRCDRALQSAYLLVEFENKDGETDYFAECPECDDVVRPEN